MVNLKFKRLNMLLVIVLSFALMGCSNNTNPTGDNVEDNPSPTIVEEDKGETVVEDKEEVAETGTPTAYEYKQALNVIEDNYRNFYEIFIYSFVDSDGDGIGDINGVISKLDYLNDGDPTTDTDLGINGIWFMPIMPSTTYHKYDVTDYYNIDPQYGTLDDFKKLLEECDQRGIKVIIDFVFNHTSAKHPWFKEAVSYLESLENGQEPNLEECPYVGYYHFTKEYNGSEDYHKAGKSEWYYECVFWDQMPDLALENPLVRQEIESIAKFWIDLGVGGFRLDAAKEFYTGTKEPNIEVLNWFSNYVKSIDEDIYLVAEVWDSEGAIAEYYKSGITSLFNFPLAQHNGLITQAARQLAKVDAVTFYTKLLAGQDKYRSNNPNFIDAPFISNHDTTRVSAQCVNNPDQMKMAAGLLLTMNGSPYIYYGEEIGMNSLGSKDENKRLPMQWSKTNVEYMTKGPQGAEEVEQKFPALDQQLEDPLSIYNYYKRAIRIRNENPEIARGEASIIQEISKETVCAVRKVYDGSEIVIVYNIKPEGDRVSLKDVGLEKLSIRGYLTTDGTAVTLKDGTLELPQYAIAILK